MLLAQSLQSQVTLLTLRESESLVELVPEVLKAKQNRDCPELLPNYESSDQLAFQVRNSCGTNSGMLIGNYQVNRRTGLVTLWGDEPQPVASAEGQLLAAQLVAQARRRIISTEEARCLAAEGARSLPGWEGADGTTGVRPFGQVNEMETTIQFTATRHSNISPTESGRMLTINLASALVRDDQTGLNIMSGGLGALTNKLLGLRSPLLLSDEDSLVVALLIPRVATNLRGGCRLSTGGAFYSQQSLLGVSCGGKNIRDSNILVDLRNGEVVDPQTGGSLSTPESTRAARDMLDHAKEHRSELEREVGKACRPL